ncbi:hypothetical protein D6C86_10106 [Aureobasidium pullulans]|uniref:Uncharacterized protein n=1 Tax=Aureobasidium pullulans TaxID=5580 RepID=A0A4S9U9V1_AURPU|nr:hypothetical protein D6C94_08059 [Aureobasidium pullulans]THZ34894.1 hypothetical protein D6C87_10160 [Aureobasidium pullulans]THZ52757.1 hypothetical protein D6C86_10106 [Aureobasidium pullulans]THZ96800.1 hypothetical protein D6C88_01464 [Aureobasidium pullulans]
MQPLHWCYVSASLVGKDVPFWVATKIRSSYIVMYDIWKEDEVPNLLLTVLQEPTANPWSDRRSSERQCGLIRMAV